MPNWGSFSFAWGPVVVLFGLGALILIMRWAFSGGSSLVQPNAPATPAEPGEYGLLVPVAAPRDYPDAQRLTEALAVAGVASTLANTTQGLRLMVFPEHAEVARTVVRRHTL